MNVRPGRSWFRTTTRPTSRLVATVLVIGGFVGCLVLSILFPELRLWFQVPAVVGIMSWYLVMMRLYQRPE